MFEEMDKIAGDFFDKYTKDPKKLSSMDKGFIESCIELGEYAVAKQFLMKFYNYSLEDAIAKILVKTKEMRLDK